MTKMLGSDAILRSLEAEGVDVEIDRTVGVGDSDADSADLREIQLGSQLRHFEPPDRRDSSLRRQRGQKLIAEARVHPRCATSSIWTG